MTEAWFIRGAERVIPPGHNSPEKWYFFNNLKYVDITVVKNMVKLLFNIVLEVLGCKINAQKSGVLLYTNNESEEKEMKCRLNSEINSLEGHRNSSEKVFK